VPHGPEDMAKPCRFFLKQSIMALRRRAPRAFRRKARKGRKNLRRRNNNIADYASLSVKRSLTTGGGFTPNSLFSLMNISLKDYVRASAVAAAYQHYRIRRVALTIKPTYDSFVPGLIGSGGPTTIGKSNLYYMIDKSGSVPTNITLEGLKQMGARPKQLDEKNITISWRPTVLEVSMTSGGATPVSQPAKYQVSPWLTTNANITAPGVFVPSDVDHLGVYWYVDQLMVSASGQTPPTYNVEVEVQFEFKKPLTLLAGNNTAIAAEYAELNRSADGIVGGNDGV